MGPQSPRHLIDLYNPIYNTYMDMLVPATPSALSERASLIRRAQSRLPVTGEDLPVGFYRADLLTLSDTTDPIDPTSKQLEEAQVLQAAYVELSYDHGYPILPGGEPFWHKLDYEPGIAYGAFQIFLDLDMNGGARELSELAHNQEFLRVLEQSSGSSPSHQRALDTLTEYYYLYYWRQRSKAHDLFKEAAYRHQRIRRAMSAEDYHYRLSEKLLREVETYLSSADFMKDLTPKTAIDALSKLVAIQRVSAGLPASGPLASKDVPITTQFEAILRQLAERPQTSDQTTRKSPLIGTVLKDPKTVRDMQELVIRITQTTVQEPEDDRPGHIIDITPSEDDQLAEDVDFHRQF